MQVRDNFCSVLLLLLLWSAAFIRTFSDMWSKFMFKKIIYCFPWLKIMKFQNRYLQTENLGFRYSISKWNVFPNYVWWKRTLSYVVSSTLRQLRRNSTDSMVFFFLVKIWNECSVCTFLPFWRNKKNQGWKITSASIAIFASFGHVNPFNTHIYSIVSYIEYYDSVILTHSTIHVECVYIDECNLINIK